MTLTEHEFIYNKYVNELNDLRKTSYSLYCDNITPLINKRTELESLIGECFWQEDVVQEQIYRLEANDISEQIRELEIKLGFDELEEKEENLTNLIKSIQENAKLELTPCEYWTSSIANTIASTNYLSSYGLVCSNVFNYNSKDAIYNLNKTFDPSKHLDFLEEVSNCLGCNATLDEMNVVHYIFEMKTTCTLAYNKEKNMWYILMDGDIVFQHNDIHETFEYFNIVR